MWSHQWTSNAPIRCLRFQAVLFYKVLCPRGSFQVRSNCLLKRGLRLSPLWEHPQWEATVGMRNTCYSDALSGWRAVTPTLLSACCSSRSPPPSVPLRTLESFQVLIAGVHSPLWCNWAQGRSQLPPLIILRVIFFFFFRRDTHFNKAHVQLTEQWLSSHLCTFPKMCFSHIYQPTGEATGFLESLKKHPQQWTWGCQEGEHCLLLEERQAHFWSSGLYRLYFHRNKTKVSNW